MDPTRWLGLLTMLAMLVGCYETHDGTAPPRDGSDGGTTDPSRPDDPDDPPPPDDPTDPLPDEPVSCSGGEEIVFRPVALHASREDPAGVAPGFDLDGRVSGDMDPAGCFQPDFTAPDGREGIDNQLAVLLPTLEGALGEDFDRMLARLDLAVGLRGVDSFRNDDCVEVRVYDVAPDGSLLDARPFATGRIARGFLEAEGGTFPTALAADGSGDDLAMLEMREARLRARISSARLSDGIVGGRLVIDRIVDVFKKFDPSLPEDLVRSTLDAVADLGPDASGVCDTVSAALELDAERRDG